jgi:hypothetical protein
MPTFIEEGPEPYEILEPVSGVEAVGITGAVLADHSWPTDPGIPAWATVRDAGERWHIECRFPDGQKYAAVEVSVECLDLAQFICDAINNRQRPAVSMVEVEHLVGSSGVKHMRIKEPGEPPLAAEQPDTASEKP